MNFEYGYFDNSNRPPPIQVKHLQSERIVASAAQKLCIFKLFPIIFYDIMDKIESFIVYKILREILDLVLSYPFRHKWLPVLNELCEAFHLAMLKYFPNKLVPKVHFIREYGQIIHDYGPATRLWCFRYEAFHSYFKKLSIRTNNFKNTPKMLAIHFRLKQCYKSIRLSQTTSKVYSVGIKKIKNSSLNILMKNILLNHFGRLDFENDLLQCNRLIHEDIEYRTSAVYVINLRSDNEQPVFAQINFILKLNEKWWLLADILKTILYNENLFAWEVKCVDYYSILDPCQLKYFYKGLDIYHVKDSSFVSFTSRLTLY